MSLSTMEPRRKWKRARQRNDGLRKICGCASRTWNKCPHTWHFNFLGHRFSLDKHLGRHVETKTEAREHADHIRGQIRAGTFVVATGAPTPPTSEQPRIPEALTLVAYGATFVKLCPRLRGKNKGKPRGKHDTSMLNALAAAPGANGEALGPRSIGSIVQADWEAAIDHERKRGRSASQLNKLRVLVSLMGRWGARKGYLSRTWIREVEEDSSLKRERGAKRDRRVEPDEEAALMKHAPQPLQRLIIAAMETLNREGELMKLQWRDVRLARLEFVVRDPKNGNDRTLPISPRFKALLVLLRHDAAGQERPGDAYVFGNECGQAVSFPRKVWDATILRAHGITPEWTNSKTLTPACREALKRINLHFHDLRHEAGSRLLEIGWPLHHIQRMLGHASLAQTADYLNVTRMGLHDSMKRFGTAPRPALQVFASEAPAEHPSAHATDARQSPQPTVN